MKWQKKPDSMLSLNPAGIPLTGIKTLKRVFFQTIGL